MQQRNSSEQSKKQKQFKWIDARSAIYGIAATAAILCVCCAVAEMDRQEAEWLAKKEAVQQTEIQAVQPTPEVVKPAVEPEAEAEPEEVETVMLWDVPLDADLQLFIVRTCEDHHIDPSIVIAMAEIESHFRSDAIGDGGDSLGLFQIQAKWHQGRMNELGVTDLFDPYQNTMVAVDYLAELIDHYDGDIEKALVAYNMGPKGAYENCFSKGVYSSEYSKAVIARWHDLQESLS